jgi:hypothetical protein
MIQESGKIEIGMAGVIGIEQTGVSTMRNKE